MQQDSQQWDIRQPFVVGRPVAVRRTDGELVSGIVLSFDDHRVKIAVKSPGSSERGVFVRYAEIIAVGHPDGFAAAPRTRFTRVRFSKGIER